MLNYGYLVYQAERTGETQPEQREGLMPSWRSAFPQHSPRLLVRLTKASCALRRPPGTDAAGGSATVRASR